MSRLCLMIFFLLQCQGAFNCVNVRERLIVDNLRLQGKHPCISSAHNHNAGGAAAGAASAHNDPNDPWTDEEVSFDLMCCWSAMALSFTCPAIQASAHLL